MMRMKIEHVQAGYAIVVFQNVLILKKGNYKSL